VFLEKDFSRNKTSIEGEGENVNGEKKKRSVPRKKMIAFN
jgi:hypothetical protein